MKLGPIRCALHKLLGWEYVAVFKPGKLSAMDGERYVARFFRAYSMVAFHKRNHWVLLRSGVALAPGRKRQHYWLGWPIAAPRWRWAPLTHKARVYYSQRDGAHAFAEPATKETA